MSRVFCPNCGYGFDEPIKFCVMCGAKMPEAGESPVPTVPAEPVVTSDVEPQAKPDAKDTLQAVIAEAQQAAEEAVSDAEEEIPSADEPAYITPAAPVLQSAPAAVLPRVEEDAPIQPYVPPQGNKSKVKKKKKASEKRTFGSVFLSILLSFLILVLSAAVLVIVEVRLSTTEAGMEKVFDDIKLSRLDVGDILLDKDFRGEKLPEYIYDEMRRAGNGRSLLSEDEIETFLDRSTIKSFIAKELSEIAQDIYSGTDTASITSRELEKLLETNEKLLISKYSVYLPNDYKELITDNAEQFGIKYLNAEHLKDTAPGAYYAAHFGLSYVTVGVLAVFIALLALAYFAVNRGRAGGALIGIGTPIFISGAVFAIGALAAKLLPDLWNTICGGIFYVQWITGSVLYAQLGVNAIAIALGAALIVAGIIANAVRRGKKASDSASAE